MAVFGSAAPGLDASPTPCPSSDSTASNNGSGFNTMPSPPPNETLPPHRASQTQPSNTSDSAQSDKAQPQQAFSVDPSAEAFLRRGLQSPRTRRRSTARFPRQSGPSQWRPLH